MLTLVQHDKKCIEPEVVKEALQRKQKIQLIDVRQPTEYEQEHIPLAVNIALSDLSQHIKQLDNDSLIVTVSTKGGGRSALAAEILREFGLNASWLCGGTTKWLAAG
jgi:rhodanese-related sulfurtransferase